MSYDPSANPNLVQPVVPEQSANMQHVDDSAQIEVAFVDENHPNTDAAEATPTADDAHKTEHTESSSDNGTDINTTRDDQIGPDYIKNKDKAEEMAHAQNDTFDSNDGKTQEEWRADWYTEGKKPSWKSPEHAAVEAGQEYDLGVALSKEKWSHINTPEEAREFASANRRVFLKYSHAIAENYNKHGDKLSPSLEALDMVHKLVGDVGYNEFATQRSNHDPNSVRVELDESNGGAVVVSTMRYTGQPKEQWRLPMFGKGEYTITETIGDPDGKFSRVETKKTRSLGEEDVANLGKILEPAIKFKAREKKSQEQARYEDEDDEPVSTSEIQRRATASMGNTEQAREAARDFPGDFM